MLETLHGAASRLLQATGATNPLRRLSRPISRRIARYYDRHGVRTLVNGDYLRLDVSCGQPYGRFAAQGYEDALYRDFVARITRASQVLDIGAYVGLFTVGAALRAGRGRVIAFEPTPASAALVRRHALLNGVAGRVRVVEAAVGREAGTTQLHLPPNANMASLVRANTLTLNAWDTSAVRALTVALTSLDTFAASEASAPEVVKIDVEGAELDVLTGGRDMLLRHRPLVFCEIHPSELAGFGATPADVHAFMDNLGYRAHPIGTPRPSGIYHIRFEP